MGRSRNRGRNWKSGLAGTVVNRPVIQPTQQPLAQPFSQQPQPNRSFWKSLGENHQQIASYSALVGVFLAFFGLYNQWSQQKDSDRQIETLRKSIQQTHVHEIKPHLFVDSSNDVVTFKPATEDSDEEATSQPADEHSKEVKIKLRNVGKGVAHNVIARVHMLRFAFDEEEQSPDDWMNHIPPEAVFSRRTIAPGDWLPFSFSHPLPTLDEDNWRGGLIGTVGFYCQDAEGHEILETQRFKLKCYKHDKAMDIITEFMTPSVHSVGNEFQKPERVRTEKEAAYIVDSIVKSEHDRLKRFYGTMPKVD